MLKWLWPRRFIADSEDTALFYAARILTEALLKTFLCYIFPCNVVNTQLNSLMGLCFSRGIQKLSFSDLAQKHASPGWE